MKECCYKCTKRYPGCQDISKCDDYRQMKERRQMILDNKTKDYDADTAYFDLKEGQKRR